MNAYCNSAEIFYEDIYLFSSNGRLLMCRESSHRGIDDIYDILTTDDVIALRREMGSFFSEGLFYLRSLIGPIIVECGVFARFGVILIIVPHSEDHLIESDNGELLIRDGRDAFVRAIMSDSHSEDLKMSRTGVEELVLLRDFAVKCFRLLGSDLEISSTLGVEGVYENKIDMDLYALVLCCSALLARKYTDERSAAIRLSIGMRGVRLDIVFKCSDKERYSGLISCIDLLLRSKESADMPWGISYLGSEICLHIVPHVREDRDSEVKQETGYGDILDD